MPIWKTKWARRRTVQRRMKGKIKINGEEVCKGCKAEAKLG